MNTNVSTNTTFQERMFERIKAQMGELMTDEELKQILDRGIGEAFFKERIVVENAGSYREEKRNLESHFTTMLREELRDKAQQHAKARVEQWFAENPEVFRAAVDEAIATGFAQVVMNHVNAHLLGPLSMLQSNVNNMMMNRR